MRKGCERGVACMPTAARAEPTLRVEELGPEALADMIVRIEELRRLLRERHEALLALIAESAHADHVAP